jgi:hypothetical protein
MKCVIPNYIPHKVKRQNFGKWFSRYQTDLQHLYDIFNQTKSSETSDKTFKQFCVFIFRCSSKYIQD